jgi:hypothetical protein
MPACIKQTAKKYKGRPGPPYSAQDCKGRTLKGNNGKMYVSRPDKRGIYKWVLQKPGTRKMKYTPIRGAQKVEIKGKDYDIIDNGATPFRVKVSALMAFIFSTHRSDATPDYYYSDKEIISIPYLKVFIGDNDLKNKNYAPKDRHPGNSILIKTSPNKYIYVGSEIYSFTTDDKIIAYYSPLGNSQVPYPYALGEKYAYFMLDKMAVPIEQIDTKKDGYSQFYEKGDQLTKKPFKATIIKHRQV